MISKPTKCLNAGRNQPVQKGKAIINKPIKYERGENMPKCEKNFSKRGETQTSVHKKGNKSQNLKNV